MPRDLLQDVTKLSDMDLCLPDGVTEVKIGPRRVTASQKLDKMARTDGTSTRIVGN